MAEAKQITTVAYRVAPERDSLPLTFQVLKFPEQWKAGLLELQREISSRRNSFVSIPIWSLNAALRAPVPDLVAISPWAAKTGDRDWLISRHPIDPSALHLIINAWIEAEFANAADPSRNRVREMVGPNDLSWSEATIDTAASRQLTNGTADPEAATYNVLPNHLAMLVETADATIVCRDEMLQFRRMALEPGASGAELVSWPPIRAERRGGNFGYFSSTIRFTVQTVPFRNHPAIYTHYGIRRWASRPGTSIPRGKTTVTILTQVPWITGLNISNCLRGASIYWPRPTNGDFKLAWADKLVPILNSLQFHQLPDPEDLRSNPESWLAGNNGMNAAIVYREAMKPQHVVGAGVSADERRRLVAQITPIVESAGLIPLAPLKSARSIITTAHNPFFPTTSQKKRAEEKILSSLECDCRRLLGRSCSGLVDLEVHYQSEAVLGALTKTLKALIGPPDSNGDDLTWHSDGLRLRLVTSPLGPLGRKLDVSSGRKIEADRIQHAVSQRIAESRNVLRLAEDRPTGAIVELANADAFERNQDPKQALRAAFADRHRVSQFIVPRGPGESDEQLQHRARAAWLDLFRQLGVRIEKPDVAALGLPNPLRIIGVWLIKRGNNNGRRNTYLPVAVCLDSQDPTVYATANGLSGLFTYPELLTAVGRGEATFLDEEKQAAHFVRSLMDELRGAGDTLIICDKQNLGRGWSWLYNNRITKDAVAFNDQPAIPIDEFPGIRIVRLRSESSSYETPEWYQVNGNDTPLPRGLWTMSDRVFASTYGKSAQAKNASQYLSKFGPWANSNDRTFAARPDTHVPNPALYELTVACVQSGDDPISVAALVHSLRITSVHYGEATMRPNPLLLAERVDEYSTHWATTSGHGAVLSSFDRAVRRN